MKILVFDPSGNFSDREGKGTTGWALFDEYGVVEFGRLEAEQYDQMELYWRAHSILISQCSYGSDLDAIVCESYKLQPSKAGAQSYSSLETPQLIGYLRMVAWEDEVPFVLQDPSIKQRFTDEVLVSTGVATKKGRNHLINGNPSVNHERDAIRHGLYYLRYGQKG